MQLCFSITTYIRGYYSVKRKENCDKEYEQKCTRDVVKVHFHVGLPLKYYSVVGNVRTSNIIS